MVTMVYVNVCLLACMHYKRPQFIKGNHLTGQLCHWHTNIVIVCCFLPEKQKHKTKKAQKKKEKISLYRLWCHNK